MYSQSDVQVHSRVLVLLRRSVCGLLGGVIKLCCLAPSRLSYVADGKIVYLSFEWGKNYNRDACLR